MKTVLAVLMSLMLSSVYAGEVRDIKEFNLAQYQGKVIYLDFWASWCKPCQKSFPWMNSLQKKYPADKFEVVTINLDARNADMIEFLKHVPAEFTVYHDPSGSVAEKFQLPGMPTSFIIDKDGKPVKKHVGFFSDKVPQMEAEIEAQL